MARDGAGSESAALRPRLRLDVQGLRGIAVLLVVVFHAGLPLPGGYVGVDLFFVISGFVITGMLQREWSETGRIALRTFYVRRFRRLTPALAAMVCVTVLVSVTLLSPGAGQPPVLWTALGAMLLFANYAVARTTGGYFDTAADTNPLLHTWTLSLEEQFYLVFPAVLILGWVLARRWRWAPHALVGALGAVSLAVAIATATGYTVPLMPDGFVGFYGPLGRAWEFAAGALLVLVMHRVNLPRLAAMLAVAAGLVFVVFAALTFDEETVFPGPATLIPVAGGLLLILGGGSPNVLSRGLGSRPLVWIGDRSYSWYLWHWPFIVFAGILWPGQWWVLALAAGVSLIPAMVSYRWIEQPIRHWRDQSRASFLRLVTATIVPVLAITSTVAFAIANGYWSPHIQAFQAASTMHAGQVRGCMTFDAVTDRTSCTWNSSTTGAPVYLVGDSIAEQLSDGLIIATAEVGRPFTVAVAAGCPVYEIEFSTDNGPYEATGESGCTEYSTSTLGWLDTAQPGTVIIASNDVAWWNPSRALPANESPIVLTLDDRRDALITSLGAAVERLQGAGHDVILVKPSPSYRYPKPGWEPQFCSPWVVYSGECMTTATVAQMDVLQSETRSAVEEVAQKYNAEVFDLRPSFCTDGVCSTRSGETELYLDGVHISVAASQMLAPALALALR